MVKLHDSPGMVGPTAFGAPLPIASAERKKSMKEKGKVEPFKPSLAQYMKRQVKQVDRPQLKTGQHLVQEIAVTEKNSAHGEPNILENNSDDLAEDKNNLGITDK